MKTTFRNIFIAICFLGGLESVHSQSVKQRENITKNYDKAALRDLQSRLSSEYKSNYNRALILAKQNNWPLIIEKADGGVSELQGVSVDGIPLYYTTTNVGSAITSRTNKIQPNGSLGLNLTGAGMFAGVWEQTKPIDHNDYKNRVFPFDNTGSTATGFHSTHVTGTIISNGNSNALGKGMASEATVWISNWTNDLAEMADAAGSGMLVSNHSYGLIATDLPNDIFGAYITSSKDLDEVLFNAPYYQAIVAAGNDRDEKPPVNPDKLGYDLLTKYSTSKNAIVVAAVYEDLNYTGPNSVFISNFSSFGPTDDNRVKPDISTKGVSVFSTDDNPNLSGYSNSSGTSMAAPGITGSLLLLQQYYSQLNFDEYMLSATLRGLMIHTASEAGAYPGPDPIFGWGLMNTGLAAQVITDSKTNKSIIAELFLKQGIPYTRKIVVTGNEPLVATIDWTDRPGKVANGVLDSKVPVLVNDLDIVISKDNDSYWPWKLGPNYTDPAVKGINDVDNVEKIEIPLPSPGTYTITVTNKGSLVGGSQEFSLIVSGIGGELSTNDLAFKTFNVWPNPINDKLNVAIESQLSDDVYVTIYDIQGKRMVNEKLDFSNNLFSGVLNVDYLSPGIYLVKVIQGDKQSVRKIIKK